MKVNGCRWSNGAGPRCAAALVMTALLGASAFGQEASLSMQQQRPAAPSLAVAPPDASDPSQRAVNEFNKRKAQYSKEMKRIRLKHFGTINKTEIRQAGIAKLREYTDPAAFGAMLEIYQDEGMDVRLAVLDHLASQKSLEGDGVLAYCAVFDKNAEARSAARERLAKREARGEFVPNVIQNVVAAGLSSRKPREAAAAGELARSLALFQAIPMMAAAQAQPAGQYWGGQPDDPSKSLAYILVGTQRSYVADLTPVVGEGAVAFDPQVGVITEGVVLRVINAYVFQYNVDLHNTLVGMTSDAWGQPTAHLGWDKQKWQEWYDRDFGPMLQKQADEKARAAVAKPAGS